MSPDLFGLQSARPMGDCSFSLTTFSGAMSTLPADESIEVPWGAIVAAVAPSDGPAIVADKARVTYLVMSALRIAQLVGKTLVGAMERRQPTVGRQRSAVHCGPSAALIYDIDGMPEDMLRQIVARLWRSGLAFLIYSSWSHGMDGKPGTRARLLIPLDEPLDVPAHGKAWWGFAGRLAPEALAAGVIDASSSRIHQQQGVWATSPDRKHAAFRISRPGAPLSADKARALPTPQGRGSAHTARVRTPGPQALRGSINDDLMGGMGGPLPSLERIGAAAAWVNASHYPDWIKAATCFKALADHLGEDAARRAWLDLSNRAADEAKRLNGDPRYDPEVIFDMLTPAMSAEAAAGTLMAMARDAALAAVEADRGATEFSEAGRRGAVYLLRYHPAAAKEVGL